MPRTPRPEWVEAEYQRIGREREQAGREADRVYRWDLVRVCVELLTWMCVGLVIMAFAFRVHTHDMGLILLQAGILVNLIGVTWTIARAYLRGENRGDW